VLSKWAAPDAGWDRVLSSVSLYDIARHAYQQAQYDEAIIALEESLALRLFAYADQPTLDKWQQARARARSGVLGGALTGWGALAGRATCPPLGRRRPVGRHRRARPRRGWHPKEWQQFVSLQIQLSGAEREEPRQSGPPPPSPACATPQGLVLPGSLFRRQKMDLANILVLRSDCLVQLAQVGGGAGRAAGSRLPAAAGQLLCMPRMWQ
jgi:hypothetical protein